MILIVVCKRHKDRKYDRQDIEHYEEEDGEEEESYMELGVEIVMYFLQESIRLFAFSTDLLSLISALCICDIESDEYYCYDHCHDEEQKDLVGVILS